MGSWVSDEAPQYAKDNVFDSLVFNSSGVFKQYGIWTGVLKDSFLGNYQYKAKDSMLIFTFDTLVSRTKVIKLTSEKLVILFEDRGYITKYERVQN